MKFAKAYIFVMALFFGRDSDAQRMVESGAYNAMLKTLLNHSVTEVSANEAMGMEDAAFLDAREKKEYNVSHIKNAIWVGYNDFDISRVKSISKDKKVIVYCSVGKRSENIAKQLKERGFTDVANMYGGLFEWVNKEYDIYDSSGKTSKVHAYNRTWGIWLNKGERIYE